MTDLSCPGCQAESHDGLLCARCSSRLVADLERLPSLVHQLEVTMTRQTSSGPSQGKASETALPFHEKASKAATYIRNQLSTWVRELELGDPLPADTVRGMAHWLAARVQRIRGHAASSEIVEEFDYCVKIALRVVDRPASKEFCGPCPTCGKDVYSRPGQVEVACRECEAVVNVQWARNRMLERVENSLASRREILTAIPDLFGVEINSSTFRSWEKRRRILEVSPGMYRVGDALDLAREAATRTVARGSASA